MKINDDILQELAAIAPTLASLDRQNCYAVPKGYFIDGLPQSFTLNDFASDSINPADKNKSIKDDFDLTYLNIISEIIIEPFQYLRNEPLYILPEHYFDILPTLILNEVKGEVLLPNQLNKNATNAEYKIPNNYFKELQQNILQKINREEAEQSLELNALLKQMQHEPVYQVPPKYFASLSNNIWSKVTETPVTTGKRILLQRSLQRAFAIAAMLALFVAGFWLIQTNQSSTFDTSAQFAQLSNQDIKDYIAENSFNFNESNLFEAAGNPEDDLLLNYIDIQQEDINLNDLDVNFINI